MGGWAVVTLALLALAGTVLGGMPTRRVGLRAPRVSAHMSSNQPSLANLEPVSSAAYLRAEVAELLDREWIKQECHQRIAGVCAETLTAKLASANADRSRMWMFLAANTRPRLGYPR
jgi:hypothetical protein